jgi:hypothetical protein
MTPDEHATRAEELLDVADETYDAVTELLGSGNADRLPDRPFDGVIAAATLAQVHATLSLRQSQ